MLQGPVSIFSHSLGSVLMWDILCNQPQLFKQLHTRPTSASLSTGPEEVAWQPDWSQVRRAAVLPTKAVLRCMCSGTYVLRDQASCLMLPDQQCQVSASGMLSMQPT